LTNTLATNPGAYAPIWDFLHTSFKEVHAVINGYRPHQARETLILMMQEQVEKVRAETRDVRDSVQRAGEVLEGLGKGQESEGRMVTGDQDEMYPERKRRKRKEAAERRVWEVLEKEVGH